MVVCFGKRSLEGCVLGALSISLALEPDAELTEIDLKQGRGLLDRSKSARRNEGKGSVRVRVRVPELQCRCRPYPCFSSVPTP